MLHVIVIILLGNPKFPFQLPLDSIHSVIIVIVQKLFTPKYPTVSVIHITVGHCTRWRKYLLVSA